jgi:hypothetical protein
MIFKIKHLERRYDFLRYAADYGYDPDTGLNITPPFNFGDIVRYNGKDAIYLGLGVSKGRHEYSYIHIIGNPARYRSTQQEIRTLVPTSDLEFIAPKPSKEEFYERYPDGPFVDPNAYKTYIFSETDEKKSPIIPKEPEPFPKLKHEEDKDEDDFKLSMDFEEFLNKKR